MSIMEFFRQALKSKSRLTPQVLLFCALMFNLSDSQSDPSTHITIATIKNKTPISS